MLYAVIAVIEEYTTILLWIAPSWYFFPTPPFSLACLSSGVELFMVNVLNPVSPQ